MGQICKKCGKEVVDGSEFCNCCGKKLNQNSNTPKIIAGAIILVIITVIATLVTVKIINNNQNNNQKDEKASSTSKDVNNEKDKSDNDDKDIQYEEIMAYIDNDITDSELKKLEKSIKSIKEVKLVEYVSKEEAFELAKEKLGENSVMLAGYTKEAHPFPASYRIIVNSKYVNEIASQINEMENIISCCSDEQLEEYNSSIESENKEADYSNMSIDQVMTFYIQPDVDDESGPKWGTSDIYRGYKIVLDKYREEASGIENMEVYYMIADINNDGTPEIIFSHGAYNGDFINTYYTFKDNKVMKIGQNVGAYSTLYKANEGDYLKQVYLHNDYEIIYDIYFEDGAIKVIDRGNRTIPNQELSNLNYEKKYGAKVLPANELNNTEELNKLR